MKRLLTYLVVVLLASAASADIYSFYSVTANDPTGDAQNIGESQLFMDVTVDVAGQATFVFTNAGPFSSSVSEIYFDSPEVTPSLDLALDCIVNGPNVKFELADMGKIKPPDLPGGNNLQVAFMADYAVDANNPAPKNGINPDEFLSLCMTYNPTYDLLDLLNTEQLRIGLHVISIGAYSESFVNNIPEPASLVMVLASATFVVFVRRRFFS